MLLGISKRGNTYLRSLMIHGMCSAFHNRHKRTNRMTDFMDRLAGRGMLTNKIVVASANKAARITWALLYRNAPFQPTAAWGGRLTDLRGETDGAVDLIGCAA